MLTCGMLCSKLSEMAPDPHPTSRHRKSVPYESPRINRRSSRTRPTSSCKNAHTAYAHETQCAQTEIRVFKHTVCVYTKSDIHLKSIYSLLQNSD